MKANWKFVYVNMPLEEGKVYPLNMTMGGNFFIKTIDRNGEGEAVHLWGFYIDSPELGICPLGVSRVKAESTLSHKALSCGKCNTEISGSSLTNPWHE